MGKKLIVFLLIVTFIATSHAATTLHWQGGGGDWKDLNWTRNGVPDSNALDDDFVGYILFTDTNFTFEPNMTNLYKSDVNGDNGLIKFESGCTWVQSDGNFIINESGNSSVAVRTNATGGGPVDINLSGTAAWVLTNKGRNNKHTITMDVNTSLTLSGSASITLINSENNSNGFDIGADCNITIKGSADLNTPDIRFISAGSRSTFFTFESGTIVVTGQNALRTAGYPEPNTPSNRINFKTSSGAGGAALVHTDITGDASNRLDGKAGFGYFCIDDVVVTNVYEQVNGYSLLITTNETAGTDTLTLEAGSSEPDYLFVIDNPDDFSTAVPDVCDYNLVCGFESASAPTVVEWHKDGAYYAAGTYDYNATSGVGIATLSLTDVNLSHDGYYYCHLENVAREVNSVEARVLLKRQVAHWKLDGNLNDSNGNYDLDPCNVDSSNYSTGLISQAITLNGVDEYGRTTFAVEEDWSQGYTVTLWVQTPEPEQGQYKSVFSFGVENGFQIDCNGGGTYRQHGNSFNYDIGQIVDSDDYPNVWSFIGISSDGDETSIYFNGKLVSTHATSASETLVASLAIGTNRKDNTNFRFQGSVDDVKLYNYGRSEDDIFLEYYNISGTPICKDELYNSLLDTNDDCVVNFVDFADLAEVWFDCGLYPGGC